VPFFDNPVGRFLCLLAARRNRLGQRQLFSAAAHVGEFGAFHGLIYAAQSMCDVSILSGQQAAPM
jgi:hypothetical protein